MINLARQAFANPLQSTLGSTLQPGAVGSVGRCPFCGNSVAIGSTFQSQPAGFNPTGFGATPSQQFGGSVPTPYALSQGFGQISPLASQFAGATSPGINPMSAQLGTNWPVGQHLSQQGVGVRTGGYGIDPRIAFGAGQQFGYQDPNAVLGLNPSIAGDPFGLLSQQWNQQAQQQLPIRSLIGAQQGFGGQSFIPGFGSPATQWVDPYRALVEAQLISQLANNPLYQLQRAYGGVPELTGLGMPVGAGQQFNPLFANVPFYG